MRPAGVSGGAGSDTRLFVEPDLQAVAILHDVVPPLESRAAALAGDRFRAGLEQPRARDDLGADEPLREVGVDLPRGVHGVVALAQGPRPHLVGTDGEERDEAEQPVARADDEREPVLLDSQLAPEGVASWEPSRHRKR